MQDELLLKLIFSNQMLFCSIFGAFGGVVHSLDLRSKVSFSVIVQKIFISSCAGLLLFFSTYDITTLTPAIKMALAIVGGFYGSALFRYLAKLCTRYLPGSDKEKEDFLNEVDQCSKRVQRNISEEEDKDNANKS